MEKLENFKLQLAILLASELVILGLLLVLGIDILFVIMMFLVILFNVVLVSWTIIRYDREKKSNDEYISRVLEMDATDAFAFGQVGIIVYDENLVVKWHNEFLAERGLDIIGKKISTWHPKINELFVGDVDEVVIEHNGFWYEITQKEDSTTLFVKDISNYETVKTLYDRTRTVLGLIQLDNYTEVSLYEDETINSQMNVNLRQPVIDWAKGHGIAIRRLKSDRFYVVLNEEIFSEIKKEKFSILNTIRTNSENMGLNITLSMAITHGIKTISELDEELFELMELIQNRGGDQVAVRFNDEDVKFYGGNSEAAEKKSRVRVRVMAKAIYDALKETKNVFIVGHKNMDFDCMGSNLLLSRIAQGYDKNVYIVSESGGIEEQCLEAMKLFADEFNSRHKFISDADAAKMIKKDDLVIAADFHNPDHCNAPITLEKANKVILIDHHRRSDKCIDKPLFIYTETSASSVCELVSEFIPYLSHKVNISEKEATIAYLGILIDTNRFKARTGSRTFEACAALRAFGVDPNEAEDLIKEDIKEFEEKSAIMRYEKVVFDNMMIAPVLRKEFVTRTNMSKCADELLHVKGIEASFVIGYTGENKVAISARSKGKVNVQKIMEAMNGGGHFTAAALLRENTTVEAIEEELISTISKMKEEEENHESNIA